MPNALSRSVRKNCGRQCFISKDRYTVPRRVSLFPNQVSAAALSGSIRLCITALRLTSSDNALSVRIDTQSQGISVLSQQASVLSARVNSNSTQMTSADNAISNAVSVEASVRTAADNALSVRIDTQSQGVSVLSQQVSALSQSLSSQAAALSVRIDTQSQAISVISQQVSALSQSLSSQAAGLSVRIDTQSQGISVLSQQVSVMSADIVSVKQNFLSALGTRVQIGVATGAQAVAVSTLVNVSGLSVSVTAGGTYQVEGQLMWNTSILSTMGAGLAYPAMAAAMGQWEGFIAQGSVIERKIWMESAANAASNSLQLSMTPATSGAFTYGATFMAMLNVSATGTVQVVMKTAGAGGFTILKGSYVRAYKIA
jgi:hypothetical protein